MSLPPSGSLDAGLIPAPFYESWGLPPWGIFEFVSNMNVFNSLLSGQWTAFRSAAGHLILPALALGTIPMAVIARMTRSSLLDVLSLDYVRTARAKGLPEKRVVIRHALRNALLPVVTVIGLSLGTLLGGAILTETIFGLSGVGKSLFDAIQSPRLRRGAGLHPDRGGRLRAGEPGGGRPLHLLEPEGADHVSDPGDQTPAGCPIRCPGTPRCP